MNSCTGNHPHIYIYVLLVVYIMPPTYNLWPNFHQELVNVFLLDTLLTKNHIAFMILPLDNFFTSRDVIFHENTFSFFNHTSDNSPPQSSLPPIFPESNDSLIPQTLYPSPLPFETPATPLSPSSSKSVSPQSSNPTQSSLFLQTNKPVPILRRKDRPRQSSVLLRDFHYGQVGMSPLSASTTKSSSSRSGTQYLLSSFISYQSLSPSHQLFINTITNTLEPTIYEQALSDPKWCEAMRTELNALENQKTWSLVPLPPNYSYKTRPGHWPGKVTRSRVCGPTRIHPDKTPRHTLI